MHFFSFLSRKFLIINLCSFALFACQNSLPATIAQPTPLPVETQPTLASSPTATPLPTLPVEPTSTPTLQPSGTAEPTLTPTSPTCLSSGGRIEMNSFHSQKLQNVIPYRIWLPPCYTENHDQRYPVLYLIHGQSFNEDQWDRLGADETAASLIASGEIAPFIIVMPHDPNWKQPKETFFDEMMIEEFIPFIDANYRTMTDRQQRVIGGLSRGAAWAIHLGFQHWELFTAIGAHSPAIFWTDTSALQRWIKVIPPGMAPRVYIDIGDHDRLEIKQSAVWFEKFLAENNLPHEWHLYLGEHNEAYWQKHVEEYIRWYTAEWVVNP